MTLSYDVELKNFDEQIKRLKGYDAISRRELTKAMGQSVTTLESAIKPLTPVYRGRLRGSIASEVTTEATGSIVGRVGSTLKDEEYPAVMEFGRRPGSKMPPIEPLIRWVHLVLGVPNDKARGVAYVVGRNIARRGIKGKHFMRDGLEKSRTRIDGYFRSAQRRIVKALSTEGGGE